MKQKCLWSTIPLPKDSSWKAGGYCLWAITNHKFSLPLTSVFDLSTSDVLDRMWVGGKPEWNMPGCMLVSDWNWWERQWIMGFPSYALAILETGPFPRNLGMDLLRAHPPRQHLIKVCFKCDFKLWQCSYSPSMELTAAAGNLALHACFVFLENLNKMSLQLTFESI